jgi:glycosyltransferase involved in cell wall biosynthesis
MKLRRNRSRTSDLEAQVDELAQRVRDIEAHAAEAIAARAAQQRALEGLQARITQLELGERVWSVMAYVRDATVEEKARVSVILATRNRSEHLPRAVASVLAQSYPMWELVAVDDGSEDDTFEVLGEFLDERVRRFRMDHGGVCAARNRALTEATGDYVVYLDDDNTMHPDWLRSVVWAFTQSPGFDVLYGAMIVSGGCNDQLGLPWLWFVPWDRARVSEFNPTDIGAVAHRAGLPEAVFDEQFAALGDWDLLWRLTQDRDPLALPVMAGTYTTNAIDRLSTSRTWQREVSQLRRKHDHDASTPDPTGAG